MARVWVDDGLRERLLAEFGTDIDADRRSRVHDSIADKRYMILPMRPAGREELARRRWRGS